MILGNYFKMYYITFEQDEFMNINSYTIESHICILVRDCQIKEHKKMSVKHKHEHQLYNA